MPKKKIPKVPILPPSPPSDPPNSNSKINVPSTPIQPFGKAGSFKKYNITGSNLQIVSIQIEPGDMIIAEAGKMTYMTGNVKMETKMRGGIGGAFKRMIAQESIFLTEFTSTGGSAIVAFAGNYPGKIEIIDLSEKGGEFIVEKDAFLCGDSTVDIDIVFTKRFGAGFFGGEGFILEKLKGSGKAFIHAGGDLIRMQLKEGQIVKVDTGCIVGMDTSVKYDITTMPDIKSALFGGEGLFLATLEGPGEVILQSMPLSKLANTLSQAVGTSHGGSSGGTGLLGGILRGSKF